MCWNKNRLKTCQPSMPGESSESSCGHGELRWHSASRTACLLPAVGGPRGGTHLEPLDSFYHWSLIHISIFDWDLHRSCIYIWQRCMQSLRKHSSDSEWLFGPRSCCCFGCCNFAQVHFTGQDWTGVVVPASHSSPWVPAMLWMLQPTFLCAGILWQSLLGKGQTTKNGYLCHRSHNKHPPSPDFQIGGGHCDFAFGSSFFLGRLVQPVTTSPFPFLSSPLHSSEHLLPTPPKICKNGPAACRVKPAVLSKAIAFWAKLCALLNCAPLVLSQAVSCAVWEGLAWLWIKVSDEKWWPKCMVGTCWDN